MSDTSATPNYSSRRGFLGTLAAAGALAATSSGFAREIASDASPAKAVGKLPLLKSVKWGMIADGRTVAEKFQICKELGFDGMELVSPADFSAEEVREASQATGLPVHGLVDMSIGTSASRRLSRKCGKRRAPFSLRRFAMHTPSAASPCCWSPER